MKTNKKLISVGVPYYVKELKGLELPESDNGGKSMKNYIVLYINKTSGNVGFDIFTAANEAEAKRSFRVCYRHGDCKIITVVEKPEV